LRERAVSPALAAGPEQRMDGGMDDWGSIR
jgi:hypothetical protein